MNKFLLSAVFLINCSAPAGSAERMSDSSGGDAPGSGGESATGGTTVFASGGDCLGCNASGTGGSVVATTGGSNGVAGCNGAGVLICEDFEGHDAGMKPSAPWEVITDTNNGSKAFTASVSAERAHSGIQSVKVTAGTTWDDRVLLGVPSLFPVPQNHFYARFWAYFEDQFPSSHASYAVATGPVADGQQEGEEVRAGTNQSILVVNFKNGAFGSDYSLRSWKDMSHSVGEDPIIGEWVCTELEFNGENQTLHFWRNDELISELSVEEGETDKVSLFSSRALWSPIYADFRVGWQPYGATSMVVFYDDIAISTERIGCSAAP